MTSFLFTATNLTIGMLRERLSQTELAALCASTHSINDIIRLSNLAWRTNFRPTNDFVTRQLMASQELSVLKPLTVRLFEFWKLVDSCKTKEGILGRIANDLAQDFILLETGIGFEVARAIRDKAGAHTSLEDAKKAVKQLPDGLFVSWLNADNYRNCYYSLGDETYVFALLVSLEDENHNSQELLQLWYNWTVHAGHAASCFHSRLFQAFILDRFPELAQPDCQDESGDCEVHLSAELVEIEEKYVFDAQDGSQLPFIGINLKP